jgi:hypothetical protein
MALVLAVCVAHVDGGSLLAGCEDGCPARPAAAADRASGYMVRAIGGQLRFSLVSFQNPDETVLLPESTDTLTVFRGVSSMKTRQVLSNFRRFLSEAVIR